MKRKIILPGSIAGAVAIVLAVVVMVQAPTLTKAQTPTLTGAEVFANNCAICHGKFGEGQVGPPLNSPPPEVAQLPPDQLLKEFTGLVRGGIPGKMPSFPEAIVSDAEVSALLSFLVTLPKPDGGRAFVDAVPRVPAVPNTSDRSYFPETGHTLAFQFKAYWETNGGETRFGLPVTEEYTDISPTDGKPYTMQLFERARLEFHPEFAGTPFEIEVGLLGSENRYVRIFNRQDELTGPQ